MNKQFLKGNSVLLGSEKHLSEKERYYRTLIHSLHEDLLVIDRDFRITDINNMALKTFGKTQQEVIGRLCYEVSHGLNEPCNEHGLPCPLHQVFDTGEPVSYRHEHVMSDGKNVLVDILASPIKDSEGNVTHVIEAIRDITDRKRVEETLRASEERLQLAADAAQMGQWDWNIVTGEVVWSQQCLALYGLPPDTPMSYERFLQALHPEDRERVDNGLRRAVENRTSYDEVKRTIWPDGSIHWTASRGQVYCDATGEPIRMIGVTFDITKWKEAEEENQSNLWFLESLDKVNRAIQGATDLEQMMSDVLGVVLSIFDCDRAFLLYPCDPEALSWSSSMERNRPEYPGIHDLGLEISTDAEVAKTFRILLDSDGPVKFGPGTPNPLPKDISERFSIKSFMSMALHPKMDKPWQFGIHQCSHPRIWTSKEERLFNEIGRRLEDALNSMLASRELKESEARYRRIVDTSNEGIWTVDKELITSFVNTRMAEIIGYQTEEMIGRPLTDFILEEEISDHYKLMERRRQGLSDHYGRRFLHRNGHTVYTFVSAVPILDAEQNFEGAFAMVTDITERKQAEEALAARDKELHNLADSSPGLMGTFYLRPDGSACMPYTSPQIENLYGLRSEDVVDDATPLLARAHPDDADGVNESIAESARTMTPWRHEFRIIHPTRGEIWLEGSTNPTRHPDGGVIWYGFVHDITKRKQAELDLKESEERYRAIVAGFDGLIYICSQDYRVEFMNDNFIRRTGYYPKGELCYKALHELDSVCPWCLNDRVFKGETVRWEVKSPKDDRWYYVVNTPIYHADGSVSKQAMILDITERKKVEEELDKHREHLEELVRNRTAELEIARNKAQQYLDIAGVILVAINADRRVTLINQKGCEVLGYAAGDIIGEDWFETFVPENIRQDVIQTFNRLMEGEIEPKEYFENPVLTKGGQERLIAWHNALLRDDGGNIIGTLSSGEDITEYKRAEDKIRRLNQNLQERAIALEAVNKELEAFAYSVSHDLRAPLRHIDGFIELLQKRTAMSLDERNQHYMDTISDSAKRMGKLIDDLLSFSRMGRYEMSKGSVDAGGLVQEVIREFEPEIENRNIHWRLGDLPVVSGDRAMLRVVLFNLISNALKFTRPVQQAEIEIGCIPDKKTETIIFVRDNGVGFDMNYADKLFNVFQRLHRVDDFEGNGIGLANVRRIIIRHGGRTWATGGLNKGATFYFSLPQIRQGGNYGSTQTHPSG